MHPRQGEPTQKDVRPNPEVNRRTFPCQCCGKQLAPLKDGTARRHGRHGECSGSGYRLAPWPFGQVLRHYAGSRWLIVATKPTEGRSFQWMTEYQMRCLSDPHASFGEGEQGRERWFHGEYLHRHGWTPEVDLMASLERSLQRAGGRSS